MRGPSAGTPDQPSQHRCLHRSMVMVATPAPIPGQNQLLPAKTPRTPTAAGVLGGRCKATPGSAVRRLAGCSPGVSWWRVPAAAVGQRPTPGAGVTCQAKGGVWSRVSWRSVLPTRAMTSSSQRPTPCHPHHHDPTWEVAVTRHHHWFTHVHPSGLPLTNATRSERAPLGFPLGFAPSRHRPRTPGREQVWNTDPKSPRRRDYTEPPKWTDLLITCDIVSHRIAADEDSRSCCGCCAPRIAPSWRLSWC
jgi:hypothetical protein